ncbi:MAG: hypothetical protein ACPGGK_05915 [Pikeienuella sp.]
MDNVLLIVRLFGVVMACGGGARFARGLMNGRRIDWSGVVLLILGMGILLALEVGRGGEIDFRDFGPALRGAIRAIVGQVF